MKSPDEVERLRCLVIRRFGIGGPFPSEIVSQCAQVGVHEVLYSYPNLEDDEIVKRATRIAMEQVAQRYRR